MNGFLTKVFSHSLWMDSSPRYSPIHYEWIPHQGILPFIMNGFLTKVFSHSLWIFKVGATCNFCVTMLSRSVPYNIIHFSCTISRDNGL
jgi:hypothetical protein